MIINAEIRNLKVKGKKFRNNGRTIGIVERTSGESIPISFKRSDIEKYLGRYGKEEIISLSLSNEVIKTKIVEIQRNVIFHYPHHIEFREV